MAELAHQELSGWSGRVVTLERMKQLALETILRVVFGARDEEAGELRDAVHGTLDTVRSMPRMLAMSLVQRDLGPRSPWGRFRLAVERFDGLLLDLVARRRAEPAGDSMLALLLDQRDEDGNPPTDRHLRDQLVALLAAGPTLGGLALMGLRTPRPPPGRSRAPARRRPRLPRGGGEGGAARTPGADDRPTEAAEPAEIGGRKLPAGVHVAACLWLALRREDLWPQAGAFRPERWLEGAPPPNPMSWIPFGGGVRRCAGAPFAEMEMREVLRAAAALTIRPARPTPERARRSALVVTPHRGGEVFVG